MQGFVIIIAKNDLWSETGTRGLIDPLEAENVKGMGRVLENLTGG